MKIYLIPVKKDDLGKTIHLLLYVGLVANWLDSLGYTMILTWLWLSSQFVISVLYHSNIVIDFILSQSFSFRYNIDGSLLHIAAKR
jgi:hypothetical protein